MAKNIMDEEEWVQQRLSGTPNLKSMSYALRNTSTWPNDFVWNCEYYENGPPGLAIAIWNLNPTKADKKDGYKSLLAKTFSLNWTDSVKLFQTFEYKIKTSWITQSFVDLNAVTPEMVADKIDKYLSKTQ
jgi:hypothetical protein